MRTAPLLTRRAATRLAVRRRVRHDRSRRPIIPATPTPHPVRSPVAFADQDVAAAGRLIDAVGRLAAAILPEAPVDSRRLGRVLAVTRGANSLIASGGAAAGLHVNELALAANYASDKHIRDDLRGVWPRRWADLGIRLLVATAGPVLAEHVVSAPTKVRRGSGFIGHDAYPYCSPVKPLLGCYVGGIDRHLLCWQIPLTTTTSWDRTASQADLEAIALAEECLEEALPGSMAEHFALAFSERELCRDLLAEAVARHPEMFTEVGLDPETVVAHAYSELCILEPLPHGSPQVRGESHGHLVFPGEVPELVAAAAGSTAGIASCGTVTDPAKLELPSRLVDLPRPTVDVWGLDIPQWGVEFHAVGDDQLLRVARTTDGARAHLWRVFGMAHDDERALALSHRAAEEWTRVCMRRAAAETPPGFNYAQEPSFRMAVRALVQFADAARVTAERTRRARSYSGR